MTLTDAHREQIRALVDAVDDPTATDIVFAVSTRPESHRSRRVVTGAVLVIVAALVALGVVFANRDGDVVKHHTSVLSITPTVPTSCVVGVDGNGGCSMRPTKASRYLGFHARVPKSAPQGWVVERKQLRVYRDPLPPAEAPLPPGVESVAVYNQVWTPPATDLSVTGTCPPYLQVRQRVALPGDENISAVQRVDLGGRVVYGELAQPSGCANTQTVSTSVFWVHDGISFTVNASDVDREQMIGIVESLYDS